MAGWAALLPRWSDFAAMRRQPVRDLLAGVTVGLVALPLALGFGISSGLGAGAGIITAIVAGVLAAVFGGSNLQISGPTGAMTVVLVPIVAELGADGVLVVGLMSGVLLIGLAYAGAGRFMSYLPLPVIEGFTIGIAVVIALQQVPAALGIRMRSGTVLGATGQAIADWIEQPVLTPVLICVAVAGSMLLAARVRPAFPVSLVAVLAATLVVALADLDVQLVGAIPAGLPAPALPQVPWSHLSALLLPAVAVAALAALESLLSATVADGMTVDERHDSNRELFGQGIANLGSPLFGGIPATAAIARTAVNARAGARTRLAAITHSLVLLLVVLVASRWVSEIPLAALAGVLVATAIQMVEVSSMLVLLRATRADGIVLVLTAVATVALDLVTAVLLGLVVAGAFALHQTARTARLDPLPLGRHDHQVAPEPLLDEHIVVFRLDGPLFFAAAHRFLLELTAIGEVRVVVLRMSRVTSLDATGARVLADAIRRLEQRGTRVLLSNIRPEHTAVLSRLGVYDELAHERHVFTSTPAAIAHARVHAARQPHRPGLPASG